MNHIIGHDDKIRYFDDAIHNNTLSHAYAFDGISGIGKSKIAKQIAEKILCKNEQAKNFFHKGSHPDYLYISAEDGKILSENSEKINAFLSMKPSLANKKVIHIDDADKMNAILQNKLLKTVEEPKVDAVFFLVSSNYEMLLDTLKSRLIRISFNPLSSSDLIDYAEANELHYNSDIIEESYGSIERLIELSDESNNKNEFDKLLMAIIENRPREIYSFISTKSEDNNLKETLNSGEKHLLHLLKTLSTEEEKSSNPAYSKIGVKEFIQMTDEIINARKKLDRKQNAGFVVTYLVHKIKEIVDDTCNRS